MQHDLPDDIMCKLPPPCGKASRAGEKSATTRNSKRHERNKELFLREVLPLIRGKMEDAPLFETAKILRNIALLDESGFRYWFSDEKKAGIWIHRGEAEKETKAKELGAEPVQHSRAFELGC